jgi:hypothetical protein
MADRIFPNRIQDEALDSDLVFQGIDWDNFNERLAKAKEPKPMPKEVEDMLKEKGEANQPSEDDTKDLSDVPKGLRDHVKKMQEKAKGKKSKNEDEDEKCPECDCDPCECDEDEDDDKDDAKGPMKRKGPKSKEDKKSYAFNHPSQISAEAIETALANGDQELANVILAVRHERRVRLAEKIERQVQAQSEKNIKLAQRKAYRQNIIDNLPVAEPKTEAKQSDEFVKVSSMNNSAKKAFAAKAIQNGFPAEYVQAMLGETVKVDNLSDIKKVMASELEPNVKVAAIKSMTKVATLTNDDYKRLKDYWKNELGYAEAWVDELFTQEYDK